MTEYVTVDVSSYQVPVDDSYNRKWLIFRICDGNYLDPKSKQNLRWALRARAAGKLDGFTGYVVYRPGMNQKIIDLLDSVGFPRDAVVMIDAENWGGQIQGDHSTDINHLASQLSFRQGANARVWGYGNRGPDQQVWPSKPRWLRWIVASYGGSKPAVAGMVGWQYTNGQYQVGGLPNSTPPFGRCDHNVLYLTDDDIQKDRGLVMDADVKAAFAALNARLDALPKEVWVNQVGSSQPWTLLTQGLHNIQVAVGAQPTELAKAIYTLLPKGTTGGLTEADVEKALKDFFGTAVNS